MRLRRAELTNGVELHFVERGVGTPVVLMHGGLGDCRAWEAQIAALAGRFRVVAYSRRHSSPNRNPPTPHSLQADVEDLDGLLRQLGIESSHWVGTSYGAVVALAAALKQPAAVRSLVLAEPPLHAWAGRTSAGAELFATFMENAWRPARAAFDRGDDPQAVRLLIDGMAGRGVFASLAPPRRELALRNAAAMRLHAQAADPFPCLSRVAVEQLGVRSMLVQGAQTSDLHRCVTDELAAAMASATRVAIAAAGHACTMDQPEAFNAALLRFLRDEAPPTAGVPGRSP